MYVDRIWSLDVLGSLVLYLSRELPTPKQSRYQEYQAQNDGENDEGVSFVRVHDVVGV